MPRDIEEPTTNEYDHEVHPAFGRVVVNRSQSTGTVLFDSDIVHNEVVTLKIHPAERQRDLKQDWIYSGNRSIIEIEMSLAQWAAMVSSFGNGSGTSCTITYRDNKPVPGLPFQSRMAESLKETRQAADEAFTDIQKAFEEYVAGGKKVAGLRKLEAAIKNAPSNVEFAGEQLTRYTERTVQHARADIEAMVNQRARDLGIDPANVTAPLALEAGEN